VGGDRRQDGPIVSGIVERAAAAIDCSIEAAVEKVIFEAGCDDEAGEWFEIQFDVGLDRQEVLVVEIGEGA
jgi:hypothetical protein